MAEPTMSLGQHEIDKVKSMPRKELNAECLHLMREQMELTQELHRMKKRMAALERVAEAAKEFTSTWGRSKGGMFYRDPEIPGTTIALMETLEEMDT